MALTEAEELELLELEEQEAKANSPQHPVQQGYLSGINKAMDDKASEYAQKSLQPEKYPLQHTVQKANMIFDIPMSGFKKAIEPITSNPKVKKVTDAAGYALGEMVEGPLTTAREFGFKGATKENVAKTLEKYPAIGELTQLGGNVLGVGGAGKLGTMLGKETVKLPSKTGGALVDAGKNFKLGDMKIKDTIAKKGYGSDLIEKKQNIANTIYEYGLTKGGNKGGAQKAAQLSQEIFDKVDGIIYDLSKSVDSPKANPVKELMGGIDAQKAPAGKRKQAQSIIDGIVNDLKDEGLDQDLTIDKLIQAKRSLDPDGSLFKNGPGTTSDDILERAIRKKMYLNLVEKIGNISPEIKTLNTEAKKLIDAEASLSAAASRVANKDAISLTDWVLGAGTLANPSAIPLLVAKKGLANGRGSDLILNTGRFLKGDKVKTVDDILPKSTTVKETSTNVDLPSDWNLPAFQRKGITPETITPITDKSRLLPAPMLGNDKLNIQKPIPSMGDRLRALGESGDPKFDKPIVERTALPSPEDIKKLYPNLSKEDIDNIIYKLNEQRLLPAPMIETNSPSQTFARQLPTLGQRLSSIGDLKGRKLTDVPFKIVKKK